MSKYRQSSFLIKNWGILPGMIFLAVFYVWPLSKGFIHSLGYMPALGSYELSWDFYLNIFNSAGFWQSFGYTLFYSLSSALLATVIGVLLALCFFRYRGNSFINYILNLPIMLPHLVVVTIIFLLFSQSGIIARFMALFIDNMQPADFGYFVNDPYGIGVILGYLFKGIPFVIATVLSVFRVANAKLYQVAENLGAEPNYIFKAVLLPLAMPNIITSFLLLLAYSIGDFELPILLGATSPKALSVLAYDYYISNDLLNRISAQAINMIIIWLSFIFLFIYIYFEKKGRSYGLDVVENKFVYPKAAPAPIWLYVAIILLSFLPLFIWSIAARWQWPYLLPTKYDFGSFAYLISPHSQTLAVVLTSVLVALVVSILTIIISLPMAKILATYKFRFKGLCYALIWAPFLTPAVAIGMSLYGFMLNINLANSYAGVIIANMIPCIPYAMLMLHTSCAFLGNKYELQAEMLGSSFWRNIFKITIPALLPAIMRAFGMVYIIAFGQYFLTFLIGGGMVKTLPIIMFPYIQQGDRNLAAAYSIVYIFTIIAGLIIFRRGLALVKGGQNK